MFLFFIFNFINIEDNIVFDKKSYDQQRISPRPCFGNMEFSHWTTEINDTLQDYDLKNPIYSGFSLRPDKKIHGADLERFTWEIQLDTLFFLSESETYKYILEGCPPRFTIVYFDSIYNNYKRLETYAMF